MANCSHHKNPLHSGGTSQGQRLPAGLANGYVQVDERGYADWIVFAQKFGAYLAFFNEKNEVNGNWQPFFSHDVSAVLGTIAIGDEKQYKSQIGGRLQKLQGATDDSDVSGLTVLLADLFAAVFTFSKALDDLLQKLPAPASDGVPPGLQLVATIENVIRLRLKDALAAALYYYKGAKSLHLLNENISAGLQIMGQKRWTILNREVDAPATILALGLHRRWWAADAAPGITNWPDYVNSINPSTPADTTIFGSAPSKPERLAHVANHALFKAIFDDYLAAFSKIVSEAEQQLLQTLEQWDTHPAHYALFLSFLKLFRVAGEELNTLTQRHLDFYYKDVLRLKRKAAAPDSAHVFVTLSKTASVLGLPAGTLFRAGKDSAGNEVAYALDRSVVFNKATVAQLKAWYRGTSADNAGTLVNENRLFAAPVVNSTDGLGEALKSTLKDWNPFVVRDKAGKVVMPKAQIGFGVASHFLFLQEGERRISVLVAAGEPANDTVKSIVFECWATTLKGWFKLPAPTVGTGTIPGEATPAAVFSFVLGGDAPPLTAYNKPVHGGEYGVSVPVLRFMLKNDDGAAYTFSDGIAALTVTKIAIDVKVGLNEAGTAVTANGLKQLAVSSEEGIIDASKPFRPFGANPRSGRSIIVGSREVFMKKGAAFALRFSWADLPQSSALIDFDKIPDPPPAGEISILIAPRVSQPEYDYGPFYPTANGSTLQKGVFVSTGTADLFNGTSTDVTVPAAPAFFQVTDADVVPPDSPAKPYDLSAVSGYVKIALNGDFGHADYQQAQTTYLIEKANKTDVPTYSFPPVAPYTPLVQSLTLSYKATTISDLTTSDEASFGQRTLQFFQIYPFGEVEAHAYLRPGSPVHLMPQFTHADEHGVPVQNVAELYIGLQDLQPNDSVNLLFQLLEGTSDPQVDKPEQHLQWSYLSNNRWQPLSARAYDDATRQFTQSGIVSLVVPGDARSDNTILPKGLTWFRASIGSDAGAVCQFLSVTAQAAKVTLRPDGVAPDFLQAPLPAGTITKLQQPVAGIKKIEQPFPSFGGRAEEAPGQFYVRVSERLRHKGRAITIWDYERLVLNAFPQIHKVKCLNHTRIEKGVYNEVAPGFVSIITIPKTVRRNDVNPLKPFTNVDLLIEIEQYLRKKTSCHVNVSANQPRFEEVQLVFALKLVDEKLEFNYYSGQLKEEITRFLSPWAYSGSAEADFGGKVHKSALINFIEERSYVDFISNVEMRHWIDGTMIAEGDTLQASTAASVLVSVPAAGHQISNITTVAVHQSNEVCTPCGKV